VVVIDDRDILQSLHEFDCCCDSDCTSVVFLVFVVSSLYDWVPLFIVTDWLLLCCQT
jgi:hypothetical protein